MYEEKRRRRVETVKLGTQEHTHTHRQTEEEGEGGEGEEEEEGEGGVALVALMSSEHWCICALNQ
jgi:hypothetical protein